MDHPADFLQLLDGRLEKTLALLGPSLGEIRVATGHQSLTGKVRVYQLEQVALVEEPHLNRTASDKLLDRLGTKRSDPIDTLDLPQHAHPLFGDHPAVAHQHKPFNAEHLSDLLDLRLQRLRIAGVALEDRYRNRDATRVGQQAVVDLELSLLAVAVVTQRRQRTGDALEVAGAQIVERQTLFIEVTPGQLSLDAVLALEQPIHGRVQVVLVGVGDSQCRRQRGDVPPARGGQLAVRLEDSSRHHRDDQIPFRRWSRRDELPKAELFHGDQHRLDVSVVG